MGRVSLLATRATELALEDAGLLDCPEQTDGRMGAAFGSGTGSPPASQVFFNSLHTKKQLKGISSMTYIKMMSNTCVANLGQFFKLKGRLIPTCSACTSGSQALGFAYEAVKFGQQDFMVAGGAEELSVSEAAMFDVLYATSIRNDAPGQTPAPFDRDRDGLVIGEGSASFVLETLESATARGARIYAELLGHGANSDGEHMTAPSVAGMQRVMKLAQRYSLPVVTFIDTPGAYPGIDAEERGQSEAIARSISLMADLKVPIVSVVIGEGGSGGALAVAVCDRLLMLEYSTYSVISPEGCASILWKDADKASSAAEAMMMCLAVAKRGVSPTFFRLSMYAPLALSKAAWGPGPYPVSTRIFSFGVMTTNPQKFVRNFPFSSRYSLYLSHDSGGTSE